MKKKKMIKYLSNQIIKNAERYGSIETTNKALRERLNESTKLLEKAQKIMIGMLDEAIEDHPVNEPVTKQQNVHMVTVTVDENELKPENILGSAEKTHGFMEDFMTKKLNALGISPKKIIGAVSNTKEPGKWTVHYTPEEQIPTV